jgi:hypothetical protein
MKNNYKSKLIKLMKLNFHLVTNEQLLTCTKNEAGNPRREVKSLLQLRNLHI